MTGVTIDEDDHGPWVEARFEPFGADTKHAGLRIQVDERNKPGMLGVSTTGRGSISRVPRRPDTGSPCRPCALLATHTGPDATSPEDERRRVCREQRVGQPDRA